MPEAKEVVEGKTDASTADNGKAEETETTRIEQADDQPKKEPEHAAEDVSLDDIEKDSDGQLVWKAGNSVYKGSDLKELLANIAKGVTEKDHYIAKSRLKEKVHVPEHLRKSKDEVEEARSQVELPDKEGIFQKHFDAMVKKSGIDPKMANWGDKEWRDYADEQGLRDFEITKRANRVDQVVNEAERLASLEYNEKTQLFVNNRILDEETEQAKEIVADFELTDEEVEKLDFESLINRVYHDPKNRNHMGVLKAGTLATEVARESRRLVASRTKSELRQKIEEDIAKGNKAKEKIKVGAGSSGGFKEKSPQFKTYEEAALSAIADANAKSKK
jgi:hypothetical protein